MCSCSNPYILNCHRDAKIVFHKLCRTTWSSRVNITESVSVMCRRQCVPHGRTRDSKASFDHIWSFWSAMLPDHRGLRNGIGCLRLCKHSRTLGHWRHWGWCHPGRRLTVSPLFLVIAVFKVINFSCRDLVCPVHCSF